MRIKRKEFLEQLESVRPGLSAREVVEQSSCFIFQDKKVFTFNDEITCHRESLLDIEGAVQAEPLLAILSKLPEKEIDISIKNNELFIRGKQRRVGIRMESKIVLPVDSVEEPKGWKKLPADFADAIKWVQPCAGDNQSEFNMTCIHLCETWMEACDNYQAIRYKIKTDIRKPTLIRKDSIKHIIEMDMIDVSQTKRWIHFRNSSGLMLSCRHWMEEYPDLKDILKGKGEPWDLPKGLREAIEKAQVFSSEDPAGDNMIIDLQPGILTITGKGAAGWFTARKKTLYKGSILQFTISTRILLELVEHFNEYKCRISKGRLKVKGGKLTYITVLGKAKEKKKEKKK